MAGPLLTAGLEEGAFNSRCLWWCHNGGGTFDGAQAGALLGTHHPAARDVEDRGYLLQVGEAKQESKMSGAVLEPMLGA